MYSGTFAMTVIIGIAATNLFLGFAAAILLGRGPRRWSDIDQAIVLQPFSLRGLLPARRPTVERIEIPLVPTPPLQKPALVEAVEQHAPADQDPVETAVAGKVGDVAARQSSPAGPAKTPSPSPRKIVLAARTPRIDDEHVPPAKTLNQQLDAWREGDLSDEIPSMSGIRIEVDGTEMDEEARGRLADVIYNRIKTQVRKDRRVLRIGSNQFAWFSGDVPPDDALMPVERIRQMLAKTRFHHQGTPITANLVAGVVVGQREDDGEALLKRLHLALQYAQEKREHATCLDTGDGPVGVEPLKIEVEQTDCEL